MANHVCPQCGGKGTEDNFGAFGRDNLDEWFGGDHDEEERFMRSYKEGAFDKPCSFCKGQKVVDDEKLAEYEDWREYQAEMEAERRAGC